MHEFNKKLWRDRALARFRRSCKKATKASRAAADEQWTRDVAHIDAIDTVVGWCMTKGITVQFGKKAGGLYDSQSKTITITSHCGPERQLYMLLHECGHHLIGFTEEDERFGKGYPFVDNPDVNTTLIHKIACLEEEFEAWNRGWRLGKRLGLVLDRDSFDVVRVECLRSYIKWAGTRRSMGTF